MTRTAPPLELIEAFIAAARAGSFRRAAERLALSPSAFSRRVRNLEVFLKTSLFDRRRSHLGLTAAGQRYLRMIEPAMDSLGRATLDFRDEHARGALRIRAPQSFTISWLLPRVATFMDRNPDVEIDVSIGRGLDELRAGSVDAVIAIGPSPPHEYPQERLIHLEAAVVAAPELLRGREPPQQLHELSAHRVLCVDQAPDLWSTWLASAGFTEQPQWSCRSYETLITMYEAAAAGLGITLGLPLFTEGYFASGRLRPCFGIRRPIDFWYSLVYASEAVSRRADMRRFARWLSSEIALSQQRFADEVASLSPTPHAPKRPQSSHAQPRPDHSSRDRRM